MHFTGLMERNGYSEKDTAFWSHNVEHLPGESKFCLTLPKNCGATFSDLKKLLKLIHVHFYKAKFTTLGAQGQKEPKRMERIIHQMLKKYYFKKLFHLNNFDQKSRFFGIASCRKLVVQHSVFEKNVENFFCTFVYGSVNKFPWPWTKKQTIAKKIFHHSLKRNGYSE